MSTEADDRVQHPKSGRLRTILVGVLVVVSCLAVVVTGITTWAHYTVLTTNGYLKIVEPVGKDPQAITALSNYIANQIISATDLQQRTTDVLPERAKFLAPPITDAVDSFISKQTNKVLSTPEAYKLWVAVNREAHSKIVGLLRGQNTLTYTQGNDVKLNTLPLISQALVWIDDKLPGWLSTRFNPPVISANTPVDQASQQLSEWLGRPLPADFGQITLLTSSALGPAKTAVRIFDALVIFLPIFTAVLIALTIWLSRRRRRTLIELGVGTTVAIIITIVIVRRLTDLLIDHVTSPATVGVVRDLINASLDPLVTITIWLVVIGVVVALVAWLAGRQDVVTASVRGAKWVATTSGDKLKADSRATVWIVAHADVLRIAGLAVGLLLLIVLSSAWWIVILLLALIVAFQLFLSWLAGSWPFAARAAQES